MINQDDITIKVNNQDLKKQKTKYVKKKYKPQKGKEKSIKLNDNVEIKASVMVSS